MRGGPLGGVSLRFRLTAWYTLLLALVLLALGLALAVLFERQLRREVDQRLLATAQEVRENARLRADPFPPRLLLPSDPFQSPGVLVQVVNASGTDISTSINLGSNVLPVPEMEEGERGPVYDEARVGGATVRLVALPIRTRNGTLLGTVVAGESVLELDRALGNLRRLLLATAIPGLILAAVGGWLLAERALRPVDEVTATAAGIAASDGAPTSLATRLRVPETGDELARLAATFNAMLDRLEAAFAAQRRFVADASHELRTPLTAIRGNVDVLARQAAAGADREADLDAALADIGRESERMARLLDDLLLLARTDAPTEATLRPRPVRLDELAADAVRTAAALAAGQTVALDATEPTTLHADPDRLLQLLLILLDNALRHTPAGGRVTVSVRLRPPAGAELQVRDTGEGILPADLPRVFDRFYRADTARARATGGTGLGLAIARAIARMHGGEISATSTPGAGATFTVVLPAPPPPLPQPPRTSAPSGAGNDGS